MVRQVTPKRKITSLSGRQTNLLLSIAVFGALVSGIVSWVVGTGAARWWTFPHAMCGFAVIILTPLKIPKSVRPGLRRKRASRFVSIAFGVAVVATVVLGVLHAAGLWVGIGYWTPLWTHILLAFICAPTLLWHMWARPARLRSVDVDRRLVLGGGLAILSAAAVAVVGELTVRATGLPGARRAATGSHEVASFDPNAMPTVSWLNDSAPTTPPGEWELSIDGASVSIEELRQRSTSLVAALDCTGGWFSEQRWDVVPISDLLPAGARSFEVASATGYRRIYAMSEATDIFVGVGYDGRPLRRGHGAPVRVVAPGRRGPWWVKWVVSIDSTDRPSWLQLPFPPT